MSATQSTSHAPLFTTTFRARKITARLIAAGIAGSLALPVPMVLAAEPAAEVYARETPIVLAQAGGPATVLYEPGSIATISPMSQAKSSPGLELRTRTAGPERRLPRLSEQLVAPKAVAAYSYYCYSDLLVDLAKGLALPPAAIGDRSSGRTVTVTNTSAQTKSFAGMVSTTGDFGAMSNCEGELAPGDSCTIEVSFAPQGPGKRTGTLDIPLGGAEALLSVPLTGPAMQYGSTPYVWPDYVQFPPTYVGERSTSCSVFVYNGNWNYYDEDLIVSRLGISPPSFLIDKNACTTPVPPYGECEISMFFQPTGPGWFEGQLTIGTNADPEYGDPGPVWLEGLGLALPAGHLVRSPTSLAFDEQLVGTTSEAKTITVRNQSSMPTFEAPGVVPNNEIPVYGFPVDIKSITISGDFAQTNDCNKLDPGETCRILVTFTPTQEGERRGSVTINSDADNSRLVTNLLGTGFIPDAAALELSAYTVSFGNQVMGRPAEEQTITLRSVGGLDLVLGNLYVAGDFSQTNNCPGTMPPGTECLIRLGFQPTVTGPRPGTLFVESNADPAVTQATLAGKGCRIFGPAGARLSTPACD